jgi:hypothetical protein
MRGLIRPKAVADRGRSGIGATLAWSGLSVAGGVVAFPVAFVIATLPGRFGSGTDSGVTLLRLDLAIWLGLFGVIAMALAWASARAVFGDIVRFRARDLVLPTAGLIIAMVEELMLHEWAETSIGYYDWQAVGPTAALSFLVVLVAVGSFAARIAPAQAASVPAGAVVVAAAGALLILAGNLPGLDGGIGPNAVPLAAAVAVAGAYAVIALVTAWRIGRSTG